MSSSSLALLRPSPQDDLSKLAASHLQHDLQQSDRDALRHASSQLATHTTVGSLLGLGLGIFLAYRVRSARSSMFNAFRAREKPVRVQFPDGRTALATNNDGEWGLNERHDGMHKDADAPPSAEPIPDLTPLLKPTTLGDVAAYTFFAAGGLFLGGETGLLTGSYMASRTVAKDAASKARIETAFRRFRADVLRKEAERLDGGASVMGGIF
ncbi:hypothetical protein MMC13_004530 [Lambiella insularis]|nr:hypothetical protein [Lambiella insularis]